MIVITFINAILFIIIGLTIDVNVWYWTILGLMISTSIINFIIDKVVDKYSDDGIGNILANNVDVIENDKKILNYIQSVIDLNEELLKDNKMLIEELKRRNENE